MIGLDTNVLLSWLISGQTRRLPDAPGYRLSVVVLVEVAWVLARTMKYSRERVCDVLEELLQASDIVVDRRDIASRALEDYRRGPADYADYFIARDNEGAGCRTTLTFDKDAGRHAGFTLLKE